MARCGEKQEEFKVAKNTSSKAWFCGEPSVEELLSDPIVHLVMARDGLSPKQVRTHLRAAARRLRPSAAEAA